VSSEELVGSPLPLEVVPPDSAVDWRQAFLGDGLACALAEHHTATGPEHTAHLWCW